MKCNFMKILEMTIMIVQVSENGPQIQRQPPNQQRQQKNAWHPQPKQKPAPQPKLKIMNRMPGQMPITEFLIRRILM